MKGINYTVMALVAVLALVFGAVFFSTNSVEKVPYAVKEVQLVSVPTADNVTNAKLDLLLADDNFEATALALAISKLDNDEIFNALEAGNISIWDVEDIISVKVDDSDVSNVDAKDKDADVELNLIVRYESADGHKLKVKVDVTALVKDGKLKDSNIDYVLA
jgi:hypothetical protein